MKTLNIVIVNAKELGERSSIVLDPLFKYRDDITVFYHHVVAVPQGNNVKFDYVFISEEKYPTYNGLVSEYMNTYIDEIKSSTDENVWWCFVNADITHLHDKWLDVFCEYVCANEDIDFDVTTGLCVKLESSSEGLVVKRFTNEGAWQAQLVEEVGKFDMNLALRSNIFEIQNSFINEKVIADVGVFKSDIPKMYDYEYALRVLNAGYTVSAIPKLIFYQLSESMSQKELEWCGNIARREFFFLPEDNRNIGELYGSFEDSKI